MGCFYKTFTGKKNVSCKHLHARRPPLKIISMFHCIKQPFTMLTDSVVRNTYRAEHAGLISAPWCLRPHMEDLQSENWTHLKSPSLTCLSVESVCQFQASFFLFVSFCFNMHFSVCSLIRVSVGFFTAWWLGSKDKCPKIESSR